MRVRPKALIDASVLWSSHQRNLLLQLAVQETISVHWTSRILDEWLRNSDAALRARLQARTLPLMQAHFPDALVAEIGGDSDVGQTDAKDWHVALAALAVSPCALVTWNLADFDLKNLAARNVVVLTPDAFLTERFDADPELIFRIAKDARANLTKSAPSWDGYLDALERKHGLRTFAAKLREFQRTEPLDEDGAEAIDALSRMELEESMADPPARTKPG